MKAQQENRTSRAGKMQFSLVLIFIFLIVPLIIILLLNSYALAASTLSIQDTETGGDCESVGVWNAASKTCTLNTDIDVSGIDAIHIDSNGITLDGAGHIINGDGTGSGVYVNGFSGVTVVNLDVRNFSNGIWLEGTTDTTLRSNYLHDDGAGVYASGNAAGNNIIRNNVALNENGIWLDSHTSNNEITSNSVSGNTTGINLSSATNCTVKGNNISGNNLGLYVFAPTSILVYNNVFDGNTNQAVTLGGGTSFNLPAPVGGNWWSDWTSPDVDSNGFVDSPYVIIYLNYDQDNLPWVTAQAWDQTAPVITNIQPAGTAHTGAVTITADYNDPEPSAGVNVASVTASFTGGPAPWPSLNCTATGSPTGSISCMPSSNLSEGMYYVQVSVADNRGNTATSNWGFSVAPYHISDIANGADCESIGSWDAASKTCTLDTNISAASIDAIHIESDGVTLDGDGHTLSGNSSYTAGVLVVGRTGVTVRNINANNFNTGIRLGSSQGCLIEGNGMLNDSDGLGVYDGANNRITGNSFDCGNHNIYIKGSTGNNLIANNMSGHVEGIRLETATGNLVKGNSLIGNSRGIAFVYSANGNTVTDNSVSYMVNFLYFDGSDSNIIHSNSFNTSYSSPVLCASGSTDNIFNGGDSIGGNYWSSYDQPEEGCSDVDPYDGFCDVEYTSLAGTGVDYEPWVADRGWQPDYYWTWYDQLSPGALNWVLLANPASKTDDAWFDLTIAGEGKALPTLDGYSAGQVPPGQALTPAYNGVMGGPVAVNARPMSGALVSQRTLWAGNSLEEVPGTEAEKLSSHFYWTWYDDLSSGYTNYVMVANPGISTVYYRIKIAGLNQSAGSWGEILPGESVYWRDGTRQGGPVEVLAWSDSVDGSTPADVLASQRVLSNGGSAFNEVPGIPETELSGDYLWTWYDNHSTGAQNWIMVANPGLTEMHYEIWIGGVKVQDDTTGGATIPAGGNIYPTFSPPDVPAATGPVRVKAYSDTGHTAAMNSIASQRIIWGPSFEEVPGYPASALTNTYHWTWYDQSAAGVYNWVMVSKQDFASNNVWYKALVGGEVQKACTQIPAEGRDTPVFPGVMGGPVEVRSYSDSSCTVPSAPGNGVMASQRVLWKGYFNETLGTVLD